MRVLRKREAQHEGPRAADAAGYRKGFSSVAASAGTAFAWLLLVYGYFWWIVIVAVPPDFPVATAVNED